MSAKTKTVASKWQDVEKLSEDLTAPTQSVLGDQGQLMKDNYGSWTHKGYD